LPAGGLCLNPTGGDPVGEDVESGPVEIGDGGGATGDRHQDGFSGPGHLGTRARRPVEVGGDQAQPADLPPARQRRCPLGDPQGGQQPFRRDVAGGAQRPAGVLVVNEAVRERDAAPEAEGEAARGGVLPEQCEELLRERAAYSRTPTAFTPLTPNRPLANRATSANGPGSHWLTSTPSREGSSDGSDSSPISSPVPNGAPYAAVVSYAGIWL